MRKKVMAANWKMYKTPDQTRDFFRDFLPMVSGHNRDEIVVCPSFLNLPAAIEAAKGSNVVIGAQNVHWKEEGAFTGETSVGQLSAWGVNRVIIGHSERRQYFGETDTEVNRKLRSALQDKLKAIVCIGESFQERESGLTERVLSRQVAATLGQVCSGDVENFCLAYEPLWAIGTGKAATPEMAAETHSFIRQEAARTLGDRAAARLRILYGGSVKPENATALMSKEEIDGALVGSASLDPESFARIVKW
jgi:triosephosphate isomerase